MWPTIVHLSHCFEVENPLFWGEQYFTLIKIMCSYTLRCYVMLWHTGEKDVRMYGLQCIDWYVTKLSYMSYKINKFNFISPYFHLRKAQSLQSSLCCKSPEINHNAHFDFWWNDTGQSKLWLFSRITLLVNCCKSHRSFKISSYIEFSFLHYSWVLKFRDTDFPLYKKTEKTELDKWNGIFFCEWNPWKVLILD